MSEDVITTATMMVRALADDFDVGVELLLEKSWPIFLFIKPDSGLTGMVLRRCGGILYRRISVLEWMCFESMIKLDRGSARLRKRDWDELTWLECERKAIQLV